MRAAAYPGEDPSTLTQPAEIALKIANLFDQKIAA